MNDQVCKVCGRVLNDHFLTLDGGIAHAGIWKGERQRICSAISGEREHMLGEISALLTVIRSLRNRAGRLRSADRVWSFEDVQAYADKLVGDRDLLIGYEQRYFVRSERE